jgi:predicted MFS family arabinose efflux permease
VLFPTLLRVATAHVPEERRGRATAVVATTAYLGFLAGPAYVGLLADEAGLRTAMTGVAALAIVFTLLARPVSVLTAMTGVVAPRSSSRSWPGRWAR